ncbi:MAG: hypothetical protein WD334_04665 [Chitinophagales bacterium]
MNNDFKIYLIPGQGADSRLFDNFELNPEFEHKHIEFELPEKNCSMKQYAMQLSKQFDNHPRKVIIGTSIGGMIAVELQEILKPEMLIVISSAKSNRELPGKYKLFKALPFYRLLSGSFLKAISKLIIPIVEPDQKKEKETFEKMLGEKDPKFLKRTLDMIINWDRREYSDTIIHIHGNKDNVIPVKNVNYNYLIEGGSHMMTLTRGKEISNLINKLLTEKK